MSSLRLDYFLRLSGRFGSSTVGALAGASPNAGGALPKSCAGAGVATGAAAGAGIGAGCAQVCSVVKPCVGGGALTH